MQRYCFILLILSICLTAEATEYDITGGNFDSTNMTYISLIPSSAIADAYLKLSGSSVMAGNLQMNGNNITTVGQISGSTTADLSLFPYVPGGYHIDVNSSRIKNVATATADTDAVPLAQAEELTNGYIAGSTAESRYVNVSGDTMPGPLEITAPTNVVPLQLYTHHYSGNPYGINLGDWDIAEDGYDLVFVKPTGVSGNLVFNDGGGAGIDPLLKGIGTPVDDTDGANKAYVDSCTNDVTDWVVSQDYKQERKVTYSPDGGLIPVGNVQTVAVQVANLDGDSIAENFGLKVWTATTTTYAPSATDWTVSFSDSTVVYTPFTGGRFVLTGTDGDLAVVLEPTAEAAIYVVVIIDDKVYASSMYYSLIP